LTPAGAGPTAQRPFPALGRREVSKSTLPPPPLEPVLAKDQHFLSLLTVEDDALQFQVASVFLKEVSRIQALLCLYFLVLLVQALLERELRRAMALHQIESLPLYPEGRACRHPTTPQLIELFENVQRHCLAHVSQFSRRAY
jgi:hypothetical protein